MKKVILFAAALLVCGAMSAQQKGDMSVSGTIGVNGGSSKEVVKYNSSSEELKTPNNTQFNFGAEFGYFLFDNFKISAGLGYAMTAIPVDQDDDDKWIKDHTNLFTIGPSVSYYVKIANGIYYTPEVGFYGTFGNYKEKEDGATYKTKLTGFSLGIDFAAVEFRPLDHFGFAASLFSFQYTNVGNNDTELMGEKVKYRIKTSNVNFVLNPTLCVRYYF